MNPSGSSPSTESRQDDAERVRHRSRKDRARWCAGKPGRVHDWRPFTPPWTIGWPMALTFRGRKYAAQRCAACGKVRYVREARS